MGALITRLQTLGLCWFIAGVGAFILILGD